MGGNNAKPARLLGPKSIATGKKDLLIPKTIHDFLGQVQNIILCLLAIFKVLLPKVDPYEEARIVARLILQPTSLEVFGSNVIRIPQPLSIHFYVLIRESIVL